MLIDCDSCAVRGAACAGCMVSTLFDAPPQAANLGVDDRRAIEVFTRAGFDVRVLADAPAPLRLVRPTRRRHVA